MEAGVGLGTAGSEPIVSSAAETDTRARFKSRGGPGARKAVDVTIFIVDDKIVQQAYAPGNVKALDHVPNDSGRWFFEVGAMRNAGD